MRKLPWTAIIADSLLTACCVLACVNAMPSAYDVAYVVDWTILAAIVCSFLLCPLIYLTKKLWPLPCLAFASLTALFGFLMRRTITDGARLLWYSAARLLSLDFSFIPTPEQPAAIADPIYAVSFFLVFAAAVFALVTAILVIKLKSPIPALLVPLPAFAVCFIYTDCRPAVFTVALLVIYIAGILFGREIRKKDFRAAGHGRLIFLGLLAVGALIVSVMPTQKKYDPIPYSQRRDVWDIFGTMSDGFFMRQGVNPKEVDLTASGNRYYNGEKAFSVYCSHKGSYLLRTHSYGLYSGNRWESAKDYNGEWRSLEALGANRDGNYESLCIRDAYMNERIVPYAFTAKEDVTVGESFIKANGKSAYVWNYLPSMFLEPTEVSAAEEDYYRFALEQYTLPDGKLKTMLLSFRDRLSSSVGWDIHLSSDSAISITDYETINSLILDPDQPYRTAMSVARYVRTHGTYTLTPGSVPSGEDFVDYFLTQSKEGYCVHFASATTALLQAVGVPARYVVGYRVDINDAYKWIDVPAFSAHAWTEVYIKGVGWIPIESTAGFPIDTGYYGNPDTGAETPEPTEAPEETPKPSFDVPDVEETMLPIGKPTPRPTVAPSHSTSTDEETATTTVRTWPIYAAVAAAAIAVWQGAGVAIRERRKRLFNQADSRAAVAAMIAYLEKLSKVGADLPENSEEMMLEALYSNHDMSEQQSKLLDLVSYNLKNVKKHRPLARFILKWVIFKL